MKCGVHTPSHAPGDIVLRPGSLNTVEFLPTIFGKLLESPKEDSKPVYIYPTTPIICHPTPPPLPPPTCLLHSYRDPFILSFMFYYTLTSKLVLFYRLVICLLHFFCLIIVQSLRYLIYSQYCWVSLSVIV